MLHVACCKLNNKNPRTPIREAGIDIGFVVCLLNHKLELRSCLFTFGKAIKLALLLLNHKLLTLLHIDTLLQRVRVHLNTVQVVDRSIVI